MVFSFATLADHVGLGIPCSNPEPGSPADEFQRKLKPSWSIPLTRGAE